MSDVLARGGYEVIEAADGVQALAHLRRESPPALIVLDLEMAVMDGWTVLAAHERDPALGTIPVLIVSGTSDVADRLAARGATYLQRPASPERLLDEAARLARVPPDQR
jgi:CheY-like chemotaxis protein